MRALAAATVSGLLTLGLSAPVVEPAAAATVQPCSSGLVALTFDDGPARNLTAQLVRTLQERHVRATFFMVGSRAKTAPAGAQSVARAGFPIGNHAWSHPKLTRLSDATVKSELRRTSRELRSHGVQPTRLMRPPYGDINARVRRDVADLGLVPVLWTIDSGDWRGGSADQIAGRILARLRPHRSNIVLQHDGVRNSPASVAAVPTVIRVARRRGYCFSVLDRSGRVQTPVPTVRATTYAGSEAGPTPARVLVSLSEPTSRPVSVWLQASSGTATAGVD